MSGMGDDRRDLSGAVFLARVVLLAVAYGAESYVVVRLMTT